VKAVAVASRAILLFLALFARWDCIPSSAQSTPAADTIHGIVINSVTHEPIARALVYSPDNRFATLTNSEGRFEFAFAKADSSGDDTSNPANSNGSRIQPHFNNRPKLTDGPQARFP